ncbi:MAG TPA: hydrogenase maturation protease [Holophagaceae bacterium]
MGLIVLGYGNPSRGDDALGPRLLERAEAWLADRPELAVATVADFQLQIEHALDLKDRDLALFLDADAGCPGAFAFAPVGPSRDASYSTHELSPSAVLDVYRAVEGQAPPPAYVLSVRGVRFDLGEPLSPPAEVHLEAAWTFLKELLADPRPEAWTAKLPFLHA